MPVAEAFLRIRSSTTPEIEAGALRLSLVARSVALRPPGGVMVWSRPAAVLVTVDGRTSRLRIIDATRWVQAALLLAALFVACCVLIRENKRKERSP